MLDALFIQHFKESILDLKSFIISCNKKSVDTGVGLIADFDSIASKENSIIATVATKIFDNSTNVENKNLIKTTESKTFAEAVLK